MKFAVLRASIEEQKQQWMAFWSRLPSERRDVYFLPEYLLASEKSGLGNAACAVAWSDRAIWLYPFLICEIDRSVKACADAPCVDIMTPYGYGGPVVTEQGEDLAFLASAWAQFRDWAVTHMIVGEFVRFHPLLRNSRWAHPEIRVVIDRKTVPIDLGAYPAALMGDSYYRVHRHMVRKAEREGFVFEVRSDPAPELHWFTALYDDTQNFLNASADTRFTSSYFGSLVAGLRERAWLGVVKKSREIAAAVLVLDGATTSHCHLMGYQRLPKTAGMTNLVYHGIALEAVRRGMSTLHMGGGRTSDEQDSLLKFKESLSPGEAIFEIGTGCHNQQEYDAIGDRWQSLHGQRPHGYFLFYRLPGPGLSSMSSSSS